ncbi:hypothetical protein LTR36_004417 [Oleoguttula mirabilis]|uniref:Telomeric single stranded DNA binding POT1/Cdc13 domain-containing protein n=1 Tax=Oleoguttula mirabilis TaxID=1507867 RepID=A0AAV9JH95_9PEZI|nr:hypothetical protein LTR36_004417 [Oleoguttula mirabilis]
MEAIPIQSLDPGVAPPAERSIRAVVTLSWPYSSSTKQCAFLLADPDARLRSRKGQVRVRFTGSSAEAVAKARIGISDEVVLRLEGARWAEHDVGSTRTPGRSVDGELVFGMRLGLTVARAGGDVEINVDAPLSPPRTANGNENAGTGTPLPRAVSGLRSSLGGVAGGVPIYSSPAFAKRLRLSGEYFLDSAYDPFMDGAGDMPLRKKLRTSFGGVGQWRYAQRSPSPVKDAPNSDIERGTTQRAVTEEAQSSDNVMLDGTHDDKVEPAIADRIGSPMQPAPQPDKLPTVDDVSPIPESAPAPVPQTESADGQFTTLGDMPGIQTKAAQIFANMLPPPLPRLQTFDTRPIIPQTQDADDANAERQHSPSTPTLQAVPNSALPLPSPFPTKAVQPLLDHAESESSPGLLEEPAGVLEDTAAPDSVAMIPDSPVDTVQGQDVHRAPEPPGTDVRDDDSQDRNDTHDDHEPRRTKKTLEKTGQELAAERETELKRAEQEARQPPPPHPVPRTPAKLPPSVFSLDGATSAAPHSQRTPQSERERVMAQTFKSLFGFRTSPEPPPPPSVLPEPATPTPLFRLSGMARTRLGALSTATQDAQPALVKEVEIAETQEDLGGFTDENAHEDVREPVEVASSPAPDDLAAQASHGHSPQEAASDTKLRSPSRSPAPAPFPEEELDTVPNPTAADSFVQADMGEIDEARSDFDLQPPPSTSYGAAEQSDRAPHISARPQPLAEPAQTLELKQPRSSAVTVIELDSSSDAEQEDRPSRNAAVPVRFETADVDARPDDESVEAEADLSSPLATSQVDEMGDEIMQDVTEDGDDLQRQTQMQAAEEGFPPQLFSSSPAPRADEQPPLGHAVFPDGSIAYFPTERVVEDSQDEVSATLSTQATPTADEEAEVIAVPDREPIAVEDADSIAVPDREPLQKPASVATSPAEPHHHNDVEMEEVAATPIAPVAFEPDEHRVPPPSTAQTAVIELGSSSPADETMLFSPEAYERSPSAPQTQIRIEDMTYRQHDAATSTEVMSPSPLKHTTFFSEAVSPSPPAPVTQIPLVGVPPGQLDAEAAIEVRSSSPPEETAEAVLSASPPVTQVRLNGVQPDAELAVEFQSSSPVEETVKAPTPSPPAAVTQIGSDGSTHRPPDVEAAVEVGFPSPIEEAAPFAQASETSQASIATQIQVENLSDRQPDDEDALQRSLMEEFVEADVLRSLSQAQRTAAAERERDYGTEVNDSIPFETQIPMDATAYQSQEHTMQLPITDTRDAVSYPTLPPSPLASKPQQEHQESHVVQQVPAETVTSVLPPTPQLTQVKSDVQAREPHPAVSQEAATASPQSEDDLAVRDKAPPAEQEAVDASLHAPQGAGDHLEPSTNERAPYNSTTIKTPARKSITARLSNVPDVISAWFSPKRSSGVADETPTKPALSIEVEDDMVSTAEGPHVPGARTSQLNSHRAEAALYVDITRTKSNGISTPLGYFTSLSRVEENLNTSSQQAFGTTTIDVLAVVTDSTKAPERAKTGQRDFFTVFRISEASLQAGSNIRVEVFRPWKAKLPVAEVGDVVLLRAFAVKSRKRQPYLLSTDMSSWCVWRFADAKVAHENEGKPAWARKRSNSASLGVREEVKGPPVELGDEERHHARALREWWVALHPEAISERVAGGREDVEMDGLISPRLPAKL